MATKKLSSHQADLLERIRGSQNQRIVCQGGGYWAIDGENVPTPNTTRTIYALVARNLLRAEDPRIPCWRATYQLV